MKKLFLILTLFLIAGTIYCQSIRDKDGYIQINKTNDTAYIAKANIDKIVNYFGTIYIMFNSVANNNALYGYYQLKVTDFPQFANAYIMLDYLKKAAAENYVQQLYYTGTAIDSTAYFINGVRQYSKQFTYTGSNITTVIIKY